MFKTKNLIEPSENELKIGFSKLFTILINEESDLANAEFESNRIRTTISINDDSGSFQAAITILEENGIKYGEYNDAKIVVRTISTGSTHY